MNRCPAFFESALISEKEPRMTPTKCLFFYVAFLFTKRKMRQMSEFELFDHKNLHEDCDCLIH